jgi:phage gpG-like protein
LGAGLADQSLKQFANNVTKAGQSNLRQHIMTLLKAMEQAGQGYAQRNYGKNGLRVRTGHLKQSIRFKALTSGVMLGVMGTAGDNANVKYAAIHEFGGTITAKNADSLRFQINGEWIMVKSVTIPRRPYISPAMDYLKGQIGKDFHKVFRSSILGKSPRSGKYFK